MTVDSALADSTVIAEFGPSSDKSKVSGPAGCTIIARNYLAQAQVLAHSFRQYVPNGRFYVLIIDGPPDLVSSKDGFQVIRIEQLQIPRLTDMCFKYDVTELSTAVKPTLLRLLLSEFNEEQVIYFDPDILIARPLYELHEAMAAADIVLIPHLLDPIPDDGHRPSEKDILLAGAYNLGFLGIRRSSTVDRFLAWWEERLAEDCRVDVARGIFVDQKWIDLVPGMFPGTVVLRDASYNVAHWNLYARKISQDGERFFVNSRPLAFFHFSGFDAHSPETISKHQDRVRIEDEPSLRNLLRLYRDLLYAHGYDESSRWEYGFSRFSDGQPVSRGMRLVYQGLTPVERAVFGDPFRAGPETNGTFRDWILKRSAATGIAPIVSWLLGQRPDLARAFPDPYGANQAEFREWLAAHGRDELGVGPELLDEAIPDSEETPAALVSGGRWANGVGALISPMGLNVCGYLRSEDGIGTVARSYVQALQSAKFPVALKDLSALSPQRAQDRTFERFDQTFPYPINLICVNADQHFSAKTHLGADYFDGRYNIAVWFWELPRFPAEWHDRFADYDEIWVASSFIADAIAQVSPIPVIRMPPAIAARQPGDRRRGRTRLQVNDDSYVFLYVFDFNSYVERKNPEGAIRAFRSAFPADEPVRLVLKTVNGDANPEALNCLRELARDSRIALYDGYWTAEEIQDLTAACDAYVSLHRAEGFGVTIADAMLHEKPVIATDWSANTDFLTIANGFPVRYRLVPLLKDFGPYRAGQIWAEPDLDHAAELMRFVRANRDEAAERSRRARLDVLATYSTPAVAERLVDRLAVIGQRLSSAGRNKVSDRVVGSEVTSASTPADGPRALQPPALPPMDIRHSLYGPVGSLAKRGVSFLLAYHTYYQQQVNDALLNSISSVIADREHLQRHLDSLSESSDRLSRLVGQLTDRTQEEGQRLSILSQRHDESVARDDELGRRFDEALAALGQQLQSALGETRDCYDMLSRGLDAAAVMDESLGATLEEQRRLFSELGPRVTHLERVFEADRERSKSVQDFAEGLGRRLDTIAEQVARVDARLAVRPYMSSDDYGAFGTRELPMGYALDAAALVSDRKSFADLFRGSEDFIAARQVVYLPFVQGRKRVVDLGCGRGEFLRLLRDNGIDAIGVEIDPDLVTRLRDEGLQVIEADALHYLAEQPEASLDVIFSAQVVEHLELKALADVIGLAKSRLKEGGLFIAETVNPECYEAMKAFYVDLTHQRPIFPQVLLKMCQTVGFRSARIFYPNGGGFTQERYDQAGEYAVIAVG